jgi:hypothetical protein
LKLEIKEVKLEIKEDPLDFNEETLDIKEEIGDHLQKAFDRKDSLKQQNAAAHEQKNALKCSKKSEWNNLIKPCYLKLVKIDDQYQQISQIAKKTGQRKKSDDCSKKFDQKSDKCPICQKDIGQKHIAAVHEERKDLKCSICNVICDSKKCLKKHIFNVHEKKKPYECTLCENFFYTNYCLKKHVYAVHGNWKPYKCSICEKAFCHEYSLKQHSADVHEEKKAQISKIKKSKKKNKHSNDSNVKKLQCGLPMSVEKSGKNKKKNKQDISYVKTFKGSSLDKIKGYGQNSVYVHEGKKAQMSKEKKSKKKKKHLKDENIAEVEKNTSVEHCGLTFYTLPYHNTMEKSRKKNKPDIYSVKTFKGSSLDEIKGYGY